MKPFYVDMVLHNILILSLKKRGWPLMDMQFIVGPDELIRYTITSNHWVTAAVHSIW